MRKTSRQLSKERKDRFKIIDDIRANLPECSEEEIQKDVEESIQSVRQNKSQ